MTRANLSGIHGIVVKIFGGNITILIAKQPVAFDHSGIELNIRASGRHQHSAGFQATDYNCNGVIRVHRVDQQP